MNSVLFTGISVGKLGLRNRLVRSATYEGAANSDGLVGDEYCNMYEELARGSVGMIITGHTFTSRSGRAMQPFQAGLDCQEKVAAYRKVTQAVHAHNTPIILQLSHAGRQSLSAMTGCRLVSSTRKASIYFRRRPRRLRNGEVRTIVNEFAIAAARAREAGFDGVQVHAAHGYLVHQFLMKHTNQLNGEFGIDNVTGIGTAFLDSVIDRMRDMCGSDYPILVKISGAMDSDARFFPERFDRLIAFLDRKRLAAIEISYGSMDYPLNIFRGDVPLNLALGHNPLFQSRSRLGRILRIVGFNFRIRPHLLPFSPMYNLMYASRAKRISDIPIISVGGFRRKSDMETAIACGNTDLIAMSRPFLREADFAAAMMRAENDHTSRCTNCNQCVAMCDAGCVTKCHNKNSTPKYNTSTER